MDEPKRLPLVPTPTKSISQRAIEMRQQTAPLGTLETNTSRVPTPLPPDAPLYRVPGSVGKIAGAIAGVMAEVGTIEKGGYNKFHNYHYARMEDLLKAVTPLMGKNGLAVIQNEIEIKQVENRLAVTYEFSIFHESGEVWPDRPRFTGMCIARNSKGDFDDKALNKCHTAARKYFLLSLFQVPSGDFDDNDADGDGKSRAAPVPAPQPKTEPKPQPPVEKAASADPHKILLGPGVGADAWATTFIQTIGMAKDRDAINKMDTANDSALSKIETGYPEIYERIRTAVERRLSDLAAQGPLGNSALPYLREDPQAAINWIAQQLLSLKDYDGAEMFWNNAVAPHEKDFSISDWELLLAEWRRTEARLSPPVDDEETDVTL